MTNDKIPTDAEIVREFIDERPDFMSAMRNCPEGDPNGDYSGWAGQAEARRVLGERLDDAKRQRREAADAAAVRVREAMAAAGESLAAFFEALGERLNATPAEPEETERPESKCAQRGPISSEYPKVGHALTCELPTYHDGAHRCACGKLW